MTITGVLEACEGPFHVESKAQDTGLWTAWAIETTLADAIERAREPETMALTTEEFRVSTPSGYVYPGWKLRLADHIRRRCR